MRASSLSTHRRIAAFAVLALMALAAVVAVFLYAPPVHGQEGEGSSLNVTFGSASVAAKTYTAGTRVNKPVSGNDFPRLPEVAVNAFEDTLYYDVSYSVSGLPSGLSWAATA